MQLLHVITTGYIEERQKNKKYSTRKGLGMILILMSYYNVHQKHIIQAAAMMLAWWMMKKDHICIVTISIARQYRKCK